MGDEPKRRSESVTVLLLAAPVLVAVGAVVLTKTDFGWIPVALGIVCVAWGWSFIFARLESPPVMTTR
jgi:1,4-dihydroxy-2-naphthoate octaprenyltransferase